MSDTLYDLAIIGGGINGAGIAAGAAERGLKVVLFEMADLASGTSSASSKLIHGGLRYLEHYEFHLVREALEEREVLLRKAPHIIWPLRFVLPRAPGMRPAAMLRAGLCLYDHLAKRERMPGSSALDLRRDPAGTALKPTLTRGFAYWDCWVDDARLVVANALAAAYRGARIATRTRVTRAIVDGATWRITAEHDGRSEVFAARALVNAAGPWTDRAASLMSEQGQAPPARVRLVKGSHIVVPRIKGAEDAYLLQNRDRRVVFLIPFEERFTLIGTTDVAFDGDPASASMSPDEESYLLAAAGDAVRQPISRDSIVWRYAGVRPLIDDGTSNPSAVSRDYRLDLKAENGAPPLLTVLGGKITTYRSLATAALDRLAPLLPGMGPPLAIDTPLPGGDVGERGIEGLRFDLMRRYPLLPAPLLARLTRRYGTRTADLLGDTRTTDDLGRPFGGGLTSREVTYLKANEWATTPGDLLWRRTKAGLAMTPVERIAAEEALSHVL